MEVTKIKSLLKILIEWGVKNKEYEMILAIYSNFNIGIPVKFLYRFRYSNIMSLNPFLTNSKIINNIYIKKLFELFQKSKYTKLENWNNSYGYKLV